MVIRDFRCTICGTTLTATKKNPTSNKHIKHMFCYKCKQVQKCRQIDISILKGRTK